jgi:serine protease Do
MVGFFCLRDFEWLPRLAEKRTKSVEFALQIIANAIAIPYNQKRCIPRRTWPPAKLPSKEPLVEEYLSEGRAERNSAVDGDTLAAPLYHDRGPLDGGTRHTGPRDASRLVPLLALLCLLALILVSPLLVGRYHYAATRGKLQAEYDVALVSLPSAKANLQDLVTASRMVVRKVSPSVVSIHRAYDRGGDGQGSGVIVDEEGFILTNYHVVEGATGLNVSLADGRTAVAGIVGGDQRIDLAVLKINMKGLTPIEWGDSNALEVGDLVWALGSPFGLDRTVTFGIVSAKQRRSSSGATASPFQEYIQTDVAVNPGNSGGPLVDLDGKLVGINTAIVGQFYQGISFAIPSEVVRSTYEKLRRDGWIERGYLGVKPRTVPANIRDRLGLEPGVGVMAAEVESYTPAKLAGMRQWDVILKWNDHEATDPFLLTQQIAATKVGSEAEVVVRRIVGGEPVDVTLKVTVGSAPRLEEFER